ncbi:helix-turn-helix domain-containing protein [Streptomyces sp. CRN 30]|uniref:helix-turn-helix domain-containing protein n=1 Tax=Streptomyces sp. CRN 30 TaxID=3075613 RepID=UPI002A83AAB0|nr:helix-turn-helix domain-containing protein [Streptomyces sp. CRN 30]
MGARTVELSRSGLRVPAIAAELGCSRKTVRCRLHCFSHSGLRRLDALTATVRAEAQSEDAAFAPAWRSR